MPKIEDKHMENPSFSVTMQLIDNYKFEIDFAEFGQIITDEPAPLGGGEGPNPSRLLAAAVANCMAASLMFAIRKFKGDPGQVSATVSGTMERIDGRWRVVTLAVDLKLGNHAVALPNLDRVLSQFENFCVVTQSVRAGIEVKVRVFDETGQELSMDDSNA
ncbi:OsmC family protein [Pseudidiomarina taiwanensis]|nr:OsmC family protein [Pseudidiomarina taiwanensis]